MTKQLDKVIKKNMNLEQAYLAVCSEYIKLQQQNQIMRKALKFYSDKRNWGSHSKGFSLQYDPMPSQIEIYKEQVAQEALKKVNEV